jgi:hypothetical protein
MEWEILNKEEKLKASLLRQRLKIIEDEKAERLRKKRLAEFEF